MTFPRIRFLLVALIIALCAASSAPVHATNLTHEAFAIHPGVYAINGPTPRSSNGLLNCDMAIYVSDGSNFTSLAAEGHLLLTPKGNAYTGTFVDNLGSANKYPASGTQIDPNTLNGNYVVNSANGKFTFAIGGGFTSTVPHKYGSTAKIGTILYGAHNYKPHPSLSVSLGTFTIGAFVPPVTGTLTLTTDALGYIVPFNGPLNVNSSFTYILNGALRNYLITSYGRYYPPDGAGDGSLTTILKVGSATVSIINAHEDTNGQRIISGDALTGSGPGTTSMNFSAH